jgi:hypothetical protein
MLQEILAQVQMPDSDPGEWAKWIIGGLIAFIVTCFYFLKWLISLAAKKVDKIVGEFQTMHREGIERLDEIKDSQIRSETKLDSNFTELKTEHKETKYAIQTLNTKIKCKESA